MLNFENIKKIFFNSSKALNFKLVEAKYATLLPLDFRNDNQVGPLFL